MQDTYDPFSYLLNEIRAHDAGRRTWTDGLRDHLLNELRADEAQEIAWGRRHLTVIHGEILDGIEAETLDDIVCDLLDLVDGAWHRFGGLADHHFTLTVAGPDAEDLIARATHLATRAKPPHWQVTATAVAVQSGQVLGTLRLEDRRDRWEDLMNSLASLLPDLLAPDATRREGWFIP